MPTTKNVLCSLLVLSTTLLGARAAARGSAGLAGPRSPVIPLFPRELASSHGLELEPLETEPKTVYSGEKACYVSAHGQRSAACARFDRASTEVFDTDEVARHHPLHI